MELAFDTMIGKTNEEIALRMKTLYHDGSGFELDGRRFSVWFDPSGIQMSAGDRARYANNAQVISWTDAAKRVGALIEAGQFGTQLENVEAPGTIRRKVAERLIYMYRDSAARENGYLSLMTDTPLIFPDCVNHLSEKMEQPEFLHGLIRQMEVFAGAVAMQPDLMRFRFLLPKDILPRLRDLTLARKELPEGEMLLPDVRGFMTQDEIDAVLTQNAPIAGAGSRIYQFFSAPHSTNEKLEFLKNEYGIGGKMPGVSGEHGSSESHDAKGIQLRKSSCPDVLLKWNQVAERVSELIRQNRYLTPNRRETDDNAPTQQPTEQVLFESYKLTVGNVLSKDEAFVNACRNSDRQNAYLEGTQAIRRIVMASDDLQLVRLYFDTPSFHERLHQELLDELYPTLAASSIPALSGCDLSSL